MTIGPQPVLMVRAKFCTPVQPFASVALTVKLKTPITTGTPVSSPAAFSASPAGTEPLVTMKL